MKLGIFVDTDRHLAAVIGIAKAAVAKGHEVVIFAMDGGTKLLPNPDFTALCSVKGVSMSYCALNAKAMSIATEGVPKDVVCGSQYNNAIMANESDRLIVL